MGDSEEKLREVKRLGSEGCNFKEGDSPIP